MTHIIAGRFTLQDEAIAATEALERAGFARERISRFYCNPPGRHAGTSIGGDHDRSPGAEDTPSGYTKGGGAGAAVGVAVGAAGTPVLGPLAPALGGLVGAHVGGLVGSAASMKDRNEEDAVGTPPEREAGMMVAVGIDDDAMQDRAVDALRSLGAMDIEAAEGTIEDGDWRDFDPFLPPALLPQGEPARR